MIDRLRRSAGCTRLCALGMDEHMLTARARFIHNGVSFSRQCDIDSFLMVTAGDSVEETLAAWMRAHHAGDQSTPFEYHRSDGQTVIVPEAEGGMF